MAFDAFELAGSKSKTPLTSFRYAPTGPAINTSNFKPFNTLEFWNQLPKDIPNELKLKLVGEQQEAQSPLNQLIPPLVQSAQQAAWAQSPEGIEYQLKLSKEMAREKAQQGLLYSTLAKLPEAMANAVNPFGGPVGAAMAYQGASAIPGIYAQTMASFPQIQVPGYSAQQYRYFQ